VGERSSLLTKALRLICKAIFKGDCLLEMASLHGAAPFLRRAGALMAFSSPIRAKDRAVMTDVSIVRYRT
jgi:hypothetical protein